MIIKFFIESAGSYWQREMLQKLHRGLCSFLPTQKFGFEISPDISIEESYSPCDVAVMFGSWKAREKGHHITRTSIAANSKCFVVIETPLLGRKVSSENSHWRMGINGYLNNQGIFCDKEKYYDRKRLDKINVSFPGWRENRNGHILMLLQLPGDASLRGNNIYEWAEYNITTIRKISNKPIRIRPHPLTNTRPGDEFYEFYWKLHKEGVKGIEISDSKITSLEKDLFDASCSIAFSSGSSIDSVLNGIPTIATDPGNFAYEISSNFSEEVNQPIKASNTEIEQWLTRLSFHQWSVEEMQEGDPWNHLFPLILNHLEEMKSIEPPAKRKKS